MEIMTSKDTLKSTQKVQLVKGEFSPAQASKVLYALIDQKINFHKIESHQQWEKDHHADINPLKERIAELEKEKRKVNDFISNLTAEGKKLKINGIIEISLID
jgi:hypothetical protein